MKPRVMQDYLGVWKIIYPWGDETRMVSQSTWQQAMKFALMVAKANHAKASR